MKWPQITMIVVYALSLYIAAAEHGQPQPRRNFWASLIGTAINFGLLWAGGFWR